MTGETFRSRDGALAGRIPDGWFSSSDEILAPSLLTWLINRDYSAIVTVKEMKLDRLSGRRVEKEGMKLLARLSMAFRTDSTTNKNTFSPPREFTMKGVQFCGYELNRGNGRQRIVVFSGGRKFYECEAFPVKGIWSMQDYTRLFTVQQSLLSSLTF